MRRGDNQKKEKRGEIVTKQLLLEASGMDKLEDIEIVSFLFKSGF